MKKIFSISLVVAFISSIALAKKNDKQAMIGNMAKLCKIELAKDPALGDTTDGEAIWKNLEDKEHAGIKLSKNCGTAHEQYEHKYHKEEANEESEVGESH